MGFSKQVVARFEEKIAVANNGCWEWTASHSSTGYGSFRIEGKTHNAHRVSYLIYRGDIEGKLHIDHLCRNRSCVNPEHLEAVTQAENTRRGLATKNVCEHGVGVTRCNDGCKRTYQREWQQNKHGYKPRKPKEVNK